MSKKYLIVGINGFFGQIHVCSPFCLFDSRKNAPMSSTRSLRNGLFGQIHVCSPFCLFDSRKNASISPTQSLLPTKLVSLRASFSNPILLHYTKPAPPRKAPTWVHPNRKRLSKAKANLWTLLESRDVQGPSLISFFLSLSIYGEKTERENTTVGK